MTATADLAIRLRRASFNHALAEADLATIGTILTPDVVMVTGTDSGVINGRKAQLLAWKREFAAPRPVIYTRTPDSILPSPVEPIAFEHGHWQGLSDGSVVASGSYTAKWRKVAGEWMIEAELYLTMA